MHFSDKTGARFRRRSRPRRRGGAILEAALVLPILLTISFGMVEFGYLFFVKHTLQGAAREGARAAILPTATNAKVTSTVATAMSAGGFANPGAYQVEVRNAQTGAPVNVATTPAETPVKVVVRGTWGNLSGGMSSVTIWLDDAKSVSGATVMMKE